MKLSLKHLSNAFLALVIAGTSATGAAAGEDLHLRTREESMKVFQVKPNAIGLEQAKNMAIGDNIDAKIAYEKLYQAHQRINTARASYFPYGAGDVAAIAVFNFWNPLILAELVTSVPSKWHNVHKHRHLKQAEAHRLDALKANLENQVAKLYYGLLKEQAVLDLTGLETRLLEELARVLEIQVRAGQALPEDLEAVDYAVLKSREGYLRLRGYLAEEKTALKILMNRKVEDGDLVFKPEAKSLSPQEVVFDLDALTKKALEKSHELKAAEQTVYAAYRAKSSEKWSILSFSGLGFNYMDRVRYAGSKIEQAEYEKEALKRNIENELVSRTTALENSVDLLVSETELSNMAKDHMFSELAKFQTGSQTVNSLIQANLYYLKDFKNLVVAHYNSLVKLEDLKRAVLNELPQQEEPQLMFAGAH